MQATKDSLDLDRNLQRSLAAGTLLGRVTYETTGATKAKLAAGLRSIERQIPAGDFRPFSDVVRFHLRGEVLLAEGKSIPALEEFKKADQLEAPTRDREYLARGLLAAAQQTNDATAASRMRDQALATYSAFALRPGLVWQWAMENPPGYLSDETFSFAKAASSYGRTDVRIETELSQYLGRRSLADAGLPEVEEAKRLVSLPMFRRSN